MGASWESCEGMLPRALLPTARPLPLRVSGERQMGFPTGTTVTRWPRALPGASICWGHAAPWSSRIGAPAQRPAHWHRGRAQPSLGINRPGPSCPQPVPGRGQSAGCWRPRGQPSQTRTGPGSPGDRGTEGPPARKGRFPAENRPGAQPPCGCGLGHCGLPPSSLHSRPFPDGSWRWGLHPHSGHPAWVGGPSSDLAPGLPPGSLLPQCS